jgi:hypothetical protein
MNSAARGGVRNNSVRNCFFSRAGLRFTLSFLVCLCIIFSAFVMFPAPVLAASISLNPTSGKVGTNIAITGGGFTPGISGTIWFDTNGNGVRNIGENYRSITVTSTGDIPANTVIPVPLTPAGQYQILADIPSGGSIEASAAFSVTPDISFTITYGPPGTVITITGNGFTASASGAIWFDSDNDTIVDSEEPQVAITTSSYGVVPSNTSVSVPDVSSGVYRIRADIPAGGSVEASKDFTVTPGITLDPATGVMNRVITISVTGGSFTPNTAGWVWFDADNDNIRDTGEPQVLVNSTAEGVLPSGVTLDTPLLPPNATYRVRADIPSGGSVETFKTFTTEKTTTSLIITKHDAHGTVLNTQNVTYQWLEANLPVQGDGTTHYYHQGPTFDRGNLWDPGESINVDSRDYGAAQGTDLKNLCNLVGGASPGDIVQIKASDDFAKIFDYEDIYNPEAAQGKLVIAWKNSSFGGYVPDYDTGMRLIFFADNSTNPWGWHVFGDWNMHETLPKSRWYFFQETWPSSSGLSVQNVYHIDIYQPRLFSCDSAGNATDNFAPGDTVYVKGVGLAPNTDYEIWIQNEPIVPSDSLSAASDPSGAQETFTTSGSGDFGPSAIWSIGTGESAAGYDIVADNQASGTTGTFDAGDAIDNPGWAGFAVSVQQYISFTVTDYNNDGIKFGMLNPGTENQPADGQPAQGSVTLTIGHETNVDVTISVKGTDFSGPRTIEIENIKYNNTDNVNSAHTLTDNLETWYSVPALTNNVTSVYYWITIPDGQAPGEYTSNFTYEAAKTP